MEVRPTPACQRTGLVRPPAPGLSGSWASEDGPRVAHCAKWQTVAPAARTEHGRFAVHSGAAGKTHEFPA